MLALTPFIANTVWADEAELTKRIERVERIVKGQGLASLLGRVDQLQNEVQRLNGENEALNHRLESMKNQQRELYLDLDKRLEEKATIPAPVISDPVSTLNSPTTTETALPATSDTQVDNIVTPSRAPVAVESGEAAYQSALQLLRSGQYEQAVKGLTAFPEKYPQSSYLPNAYYWQGEANYVLRHFDLAIAAFQIVIDKFPTSSKVADATLKQGFSQYELGSLDVAKATLTRVIEQYPTTSAARLAKVRLDRIKHEVQN